MAEDVAESVSGVKQVHNQLRIQQESGREAGTQGRKGAGSEASHQETLTGTGTKR